MRPVAWVLAPMLGLLTSARAPLRAADVHEQRTPWVPLILEVAYRPKGWLGIMLGSRLYYEFTEAALSNAQDWERVADSVSQEVRRHGAPPPSSQAAAEARPQEAVDVVAVTAVADAPAAPSRTIPRPPSPMREAAAGVSVSSVVHNNSNATNNFNNNSSTDNSNNNIGNTSIVLL